jgi:hypothetical protein
MSTVNPYAPPEARVEDVSDVPAGAEAIRREYIKHESSVRSIGMLYYIGGVLMLLATIGILVGLSTATGALGEQRAVLSIVMVVYAGLGVLSIFLGRGIRRLAGWARTTATVLSIIGLIGFPVGTLINGYILYLLHCAKGKRIFEPDYAGIVEATPHIKYRTSMIVWIVLSLLVLVVVAVVVGTMNR